MNPVLRPILAASLALALPSHAAWQTERTLSSPDGSLTLTLERDDANGALAWSLARSGAPIITRGSLGIDLTGVGTVGGQGTISAVETRSVNTTWTPPYGEWSTIPDHFNEETLTLSHASHGALTVRLEFRAYDEGVALRYRIDGPGTLSVSGEKTSFPLPASSVVWVTTSAQGAISRVGIGSMGNGMERPLTAELAPNLFVALGEAGLRNHARMKFNRSGTSTLVPALASSATYADTFASPWRYVRAAASAYELHHGNHLLLNLSEPSEVADTSWIRPGKMLREVTLTTEGSMATVNWAANHGIDFLHIDAGWYGDEYDDASDATTVTVDPKRSPGPLDLQAVIDHAKSKGLGVVLYVNRRALERQLDDLLPLYQQWGVAGIKFGFVNVGSQDWTKWLHDSIAKCANHQIMVNVHDEYRMTGVERTLPHFMTAEGIRGDEESPPNEMVLRTLFTRSLAGAGDQTNCYFAPRVSTMGSHASQLAKTVLIYSPWQYLFWYDRPPDAGGSGSVLQDVPELSFFERLPTVWDETRWLQGHPETHAVVARRKGDAWFLGGLNGTTAREFTIPLDFLPANQNFRLELFRDDPAVNTVTHVAIDVRVVDRTFTIERPVGSRNGLAAILTPTSDPLTPPPPPPPPGPNPAKLVAIADTTLLQNGMSARDANFGGRTEVILGGNGNTTDVRHGLFRFDISTISSQITAGTDIQSATLTLTEAMARDTSHNGTLSQTFSVFGLTAANAGWVEGSENGNLQAGTASLSYRNTASTDWASGAGNGPTAEDLFTFGTDTGASLGSGTVNFATGSQQTLVITITDLAAFKTLLAQWQAQGATTNAGLAIQSNGTSQTMWESRETGLGTSPARLDITFVTPYDAWAGGPFAADLTDSDPSLDFDGGSLETGLEWVLGGDPTDGSDDADIAPTFDNTTDPDFFIFTYRRTDAAAADANTAIKVEYGSDLSGWAEAVAEENIVIITPDDDGAGVGIDLVQVKIRRTLAADGKLFARLNVVVATTP
jgi:alpha-glucosidase